MSAHRDEHLELCAALALGAIDDADRRVIDAHLADGCAVCEAELVHLAGTVEQLATLAPPHPAPATLKRRVLAAALAERPAGREASSLSRPVSVLSRDVRAPALELPRGRSSLLTWALATAAALLAVSTLTDHREVGRLRRELSDTSRELAETQRLVEVLNAPDAKVVDLALTPAGEAGLEARATLDPRSRRAVIVLANATPPIRMDYQLWVIRVSGPTSLGLVHADEHGRAVARIEDVGDPSQVLAFAVSLEAAGGSPDPHAPKGPMVLVGKLGG